MQIVYRSGHADEQKWIFDRQNPSWDVSYPVEKVTDWGWLEFLKRLDAMSPTAWRALIWALRKADEPRLKIEYVTIDDWSELDLRIQCFRCEEFVRPDGDHECPIQADEDDEQADIEVEVGDVDPEA
jgi:hypothetical protein